MGLAVGLQACPSATHTTSAGADNTGSNPAQGSVEDLTIVVEADKSRIVQEEAVVKAGKQEVEAQRQHLEKERAEVAERLSNLSQQDKASRQQLEATQQGLLEHERALRSRADHYEEARYKLDADKNALLERIGKLTATSPAGANQTLPAREENIARREAVLAAREKDLAAREAAAITAMGDVKQLVEEVRQSVATLRTASAPMPLTPQAAASSVPVATRASVSRALKAARTKMQVKGVLNEDLPPALQNFANAAATAATSRDLAGAQVMCDRVAQSVDSVAINHAFVEGKMARINRLLGSRSARLDAAGQKRIQDLLGEATDAYSDGRYDRANKKINQICALLSGPEAR
jgi:hypothetical protein